MSKPERFIVIGDTHGDMAHQPSLKVVRSFLKCWKPTIRIHLGDLFDMRPLRNGASDEERRSGIMDDVVAGIDLIDWYKPTHFLRGNHDERLWDMLAQSNKTKSEIASELIQKIQARLDAVKCAPMLPYNKRDGVLRLGRLNVIHGFHHGNNAASSAARVYDNVMQGHAHSIQGMPIPGLSPRSGRAIGCLCNLELGYNRASANTLAWEHGFAYGILHRDGNYQEWQARPTGGRWYLPTEMSSHEYVHH